MAQEIIDLDELLGSDKRVKLGGKVYLLAPDLPADLYLEIIRFSREEHSEAELIEALYERLLDLFRYKQPDLKALPMSVGQVVQAVGRIYGDEGAEKKPRPPRTRGATTSKRKRSS
jgi:hypothetical protein